MAKHTGGEWGVCLIDGGAEDDEIVTQVNGCLVNIAAVFGEGEYSEARPKGEEEPHYKVSKEEAAANALLISAAPNLLGALRRTQALLFLHTKKDDEDSMAALSEALAAIEKATKG